MKVFTSGDGRNIRDIVIEIKERTIFFYHKYPNNEKLEQFYWLFESDWKDDGIGNWHIKDHMRKKNWFTHEMENYIDQNIKQCQQK